MSATKQRKEIDKARDHLFDFIEKSAKWGPRLADSMHQLMAPVAEHLEVDVNTALDRLMDGPVGFMAYNFFMEEMALMIWNNEALAPIDDFLKRRGQREGSSGRLYLRLLKSSELQFLEVTAVEPGQWVECRAYGSEGSSDLIWEKSASQGLHRWDSVIARVYSDGKKLRFSGSILPLSKNGAEYVQDRLDSIAAEFEGYYQEMVEEGDVEGVTVNLVDEIPEERLNRITEDGFACWAIDVLDPQQRILSNTDGERLVISQFRFPVTDPDNLPLDNLSGHPDIVDEGGHHWTWLTSTEPGTVLGRIQLKDKHILLESNSVERGEKGVNLIQSLLGDSIGQPVGVHEEIDQGPDSMPASAIEQPDLDLQQNPELQAMLQDHLTNHYRKTLDEPIPMLNDESPRACAADPEKHALVVAWLKHLENTDARGSGPAYDAAWMWAELGLEKFRV